MKRFMVLACLATALCLAEDKPVIRIFDGEGNRVQAPLLVTSDYAFTVKKKEHGVELRLGDSDARKLAAISRHYVGKHLCFTVGDMAKSCPKMGDALVGKGFWLTFRDVTSLEAMEKALTGTPGSR